MSTLSIFFDLHSLQDKVDTFGQVYADSLEPSLYCHDSLDMGHVTLCDEDSLDSVASYKHSPCDSLDSDEASHLSCDSLEVQCVEDVWEQEEENQSDHITPRTSSAEHCGCQHLVSHGGRVSSDKIPGQHVPTNVLEFLIFFGINRNTNENGEVSWYKIEIVPCYREL